MKINKLIQSGIFIFLFLIIVTAALAALPQVTIEPENPTTDNELTCKVNGQTAGYIFVWSKEGSSQTFPMNPLPAAETKPEETWICKAYFPSYPTDILVGEARVTIAQEEVVPVGIKITIEPENPTDADALTCKVNGQTAGYIFVWSKFGRTVEANPLPASETGPGETWTCKVYFPAWPTDILIGQKSVTIQGSIPKIVDIKPDKPKTMDDLNCVVGNNPANPGYIFKWSKDGQVHNEDEDTISNRQTLKGQSWRCKVYFPAWPTDIFIGEDTEVIQNTPPTLTNIPEQTVHVGEGFTYSVGVQDPDVGEGTDRLVLVLENAPVGMSINNQGKVAWTPSSNQERKTYQPKVKVSDNENAKAEKIFKINLVNRQPRLEELENKQITESETLTFEVIARDDDGDSLELTAEGKPTTATFEPASCSGGEGLIGFIKQFFGFGNLLCNLLGYEKYVFSWTPSYEEADVYPITFKAKDNFRGQAEQTITITVTDKNRAPTINPIEDLTVKVRETVTFRVTATDPDNDQLVYSIKNKPNDATFQNQIFTWTPQEEVTKKIIFTADDRKGGYDEEEVIIKVKPVEENKPPVLEPIGPKRVREKERLTFEVKATDPDNDSLTYTQPENLPKGASYVQINNKAVFDWTPALGQAGDHSVTFIVRDNHNHAVKETIVIKVLKEILGENQPPVLDEIGNKTVRENEELTFEVTADDPDNDPLTYAYRGLPQGASLVQVDSKAVFSWTPASGQAGRYEMTFIVRDDHNHSDNETIFIEVFEEEALKHAPVFTPIGDKYLKEGETLSFRVTATDEDNDPLTYTAENLPASAAFQNQIFTWTPDYQQAGNYQVIFKVSDGELEDLMTVKIFVEDVVVPLNTAPKIISSPSRTFREKQLYQYQVRVLNTENDPLTYSLLQWPTGMKIDQNGLVEWTPEHQGKFCVIVKVTENTVDKFSDSQHFCLNVRDTEKALKFDSLQLSSEAVQPGDYLTVYIDLANEGKENLKEIKITATIVELGVERAVGPFDLNKGKSVHERLYLEIPDDAEAGEYYVRIVASNDETAHVVHRPIQII